MHGDKKVAGLVYSYTYTYHISVLGSRSRLLHRFDYHRVGGIDFPACTGHHFSFWTT